MLRYEAWSRASRLELTYSFHCAFLDRNGQRDDPRANGAVDLRQDAMILRPLRTDFPVSHVAEFGKVVEVHDVAHSLIGVWA